MSKTTPEADAAARTGFDPERFFQLARQVGHGRAIGMEYRGHGDDWIELSLPWREQLVGVPQSGILASGAIVSLIDTCAGMSVWIARGHFRPMATLDLRIDYLKPAPKGASVYARCQCYKITRSVAFVRGTAHLGDVDDPIAQAALTFMTTS
jgi:uncharacterized protein (TIGR00369 family)